jgi:hypothetical protein
VGRLRGSGLRAAQATELAEVELEVNGDEVAEEEEGELEGAEEEAELGCAPA